MVEPARVSAASGVPLTRVWRPGRPVDLVATLGPLRRGGSDPAFRTGAGSGSWVWRTTRTPEGPVTLRLVVHPSEGTVEQVSWGPGSGWAADRLPASLGSGDDPRGFDPGPLPGPLLRAWRRRGTSWRVPATGRVLEALVAAVLEQKVDRGRGPPVLAACCWPVR